MSTGKIEVRLQHAEVMNRCRKLPFETKELVKVNPGMKYNMNNCRSPTQQTTYSLSSYGSTAGNHFLNHYPYFQLFLVQWWCCLKFHYSTPNVLPALSIHGPMESVLFNVACLYIFPIHPILWIFSGSAKTKQMLTCSHPSRLWPACTSLPAFWQSVWRRVPTLKCYPPPNL